MNPRPCPTCGADVLGPPDAPLDAHPHELGVTAADGRTLTVAEIVNAHRAGHVIGHHPHRCPPKADPQLKLDI